MGAYLVELFPTSIRATNQGFSYNAGRAIGALFPAAIGYMARSLGLSTAIGLFTLGSYACLFAALLLLPETRVRSLHDSVSPGAPAEA